MRAHGGADLAGVRGSIVLLLWIILFAAFGGIASAAFAVAFLWVPEERSARILPHCVSFATGALLGAALLALLPEAIEGAGTAGAHDIGLALVLGLGIFFVIEKLVLWWHAHSQDEDPGEHHDGHHGDRHQHTPHRHEPLREQASGVLLLVGLGIAVIALAERLTDK